MSLPTPSPNQAYWRVSALNTGTIHLPERHPISDPSSTSHHRTTSRPCLSFLMQHSKNKSIKALFDLGLRKDPQSYPPAIQHRLHQRHLALSVPYDVRDTLLSSGIQPHEISYVFLSHLHYDSIGDPRLFPNAMFLLGNAGYPLLERGYPYDAKSQFSSHALPPERLIWLTPEDELTWKPLGPFPRANDIYKDGSMYIIDAPGHLEGHINLLIRTSRRGSWVYLAADTAADARVLRGEKPAATYVDDVVGCTRGAHRDPKAAEEHMGRVRKLLNMRGEGGGPVVEVVLGHDAEWAGRNRDQGFLPKKIHEVYQG